MPGRISIVCFASCYAIAFILELFRCRFRFRWGKSAVLLTSIAGLIAQSFYICNNFLLKNDHLITSIGGWFFVLVFALILFYVFSLLFRDKSNFGLFLLPPAFILIGLASLLENIYFPAQATGACIRGLHTIFLLLAAFFIATGFIFGLLYFHQRAHLKHKTPPPDFFRLPSLETIMKWNRKALFFSDIFLGLGILTGYYIRWILTEHGLVRSNGCDPMILGAFILCLLLSLFLVLSSRTRFFVEGNAAALLAIFSFVILILSILSALIFSPGHWKEVEPIRFFSDRPVIFAPIETGSSSKAFPDIENNKANEPNASRKMIPADPAAPSVEESK